MVMEFGLISIRGPLRVYLESSVLIAKIVREISFARTAGAMVMVLAFRSAIAGKFFLGNPAIRKRLAPQVTVTQFPSPRLNLISLSGRARTISHNRFAGSVIGPAAARFV